MVEGVTTGIDDGAEIGPVVENGAVIVSLVIGGCDSGMAEGVTTGGDDGPEAGSVGVNGAVVDVPLATGG